MKQIKKNKKQESGRSMIEMVGVLAVMGLITAGAFVLISSAMRSQKISRVDDDVSAIVAGTRLLYNSQENFSGLNNTAIEALGFSGTNPFGGNYYISVNSSDKTKFDVFIGGLSQSECNTLKSRNWPGNNTAIAGGTAVTLGTNNIASMTGNACGAAVKITYGKVQ